MAHEPKNFDPLIGQLGGFLSENQLKAHFTLYQGYVKKLNEIEEKLAKADRATANYSYGEYSELRRREPVAYNGTVLHEIYFQNLGPAGSAPAPEVKQAFEQSFGSWDGWVADVKAIIGSGHGWCLVTFDHNHGKVRNNFVSSEHHNGLFANQEILFALDAWEHAYFMDYGTKKPDYVTGLMKHLKWDAANASVKMTLARLAQMAGKK
jgi:superoxide dismutase, Fe-Mn family